MPTLIIAGDHAGSGKTSLTAGLLVLLERAGRRAAYCKPFSVTPDDDADHRFASGSLGDAAGPTPRPLSGNVDEAAAAIAELRSRHETVIVEAAAGSPATQLAAATDGRVLEVRSYAPQRYWSQAADEAVGCWGARLAGVVVNNVPPYRMESVAHSTVAPGAPAPLALPESRFMLAPTVAEIAAHLGGEWVLDPVNTDALVEHYLIGGNIMDSGPNYFGRYANQAVIARAQRPDILLAAMSPETRCLVLTGPGEANQYITAEARERDIPLIRVAASTVEAAESLAGLRDSTCSMAKARHFADLIASHTSPETLAGWLGRNP